MHRSGGSMALMVVFFFCVVIGAHSYVAWHLASVLESRPWQWFVWTLFLTLSIAAPLAMILGRLYLNAQANRLLLLISYGWLGFFFMLLSVAFAIDVGALLIATWAKVIRSDTAVDGVRRLHILRMVRATEVAIATVGAWHAFWVTRRGPVVEHVTVGLQRLPRSLDGFTIAQISDLHVAALLRREYVEQVVHLTNALQPQLIAITGDLVDGKVADLQHHVAPLRDLRATYGSYFVTGNHEYYSGVEAWIQEVSRLGMRVLRNERVSIGPKGQSFDLAGIDDWTAAQFGGDHGPDLGRALAGRDASRELVLLAHQPKAVFEAAQHGVGLMLSGHTHGGQIFPFGALVRLAQPFVRGLHRLKQTQIYVNRGTGYWGPPMRLGSDPEITCITLRAV